ncbi:DUF2380 domain-containing protein [Bradyrhizobium sp. SYSU BS000235]|uniref:DUF2380 domain-containing protein n=1 Tax=Bradyrhizobium sp. SYSU BS000235 TaxID=3411332 RepID=UPI003C75967F
MRFRLHRPSIVLASALIALGFAAPAARSETTPSSKLAVASFNFEDTSGEAKNDKTPHDAMLKDFQSIVSKTLSDKLKLDVTPLPCAPDKCSLADPGMEALADMAKKADARYLVAGGLHKMSTLVGWAKVVVVDLGPNGKVCDRLLSYRGDNSEAWERAAKFAAGDLINHCMR